MDTIIFNIIYYYTKKIVYAYKILQLLLVKSALKVAEWEAREMK